MNERTPTSPTPVSKPKPRPRPQVMKLTDAAAQRIQELTERADSEIVGLRVGIKNGGRARQVYTGGYSPRGRAVPARHRDGLQGRQDAGPVHLQQPEPGFGLRLRRVGAAQACADVTLS